MGSLPRELPHELSGVAIAPRSESLQAANSTSLMAALSESSRTSAKRRRWRLWIVAAMLLGTGALSLRSWQDNTGAASSADPAAAETADAAETSAASTLPVRVVAIEPVSGYETERAYTGEIVARRSSELGFELSGKVVSLLVDEGDFVGAGQAIARLDTATLEAQRRELEAEIAVQLAQLQELEAGPRQQTIDAARAAVADLDTQLELSRIQESRRLELFEGGAISRDSYDRQAFNTASLESRRDQAQRQLDELLAGTRVEQVQAQDARLGQIRASIDSIDVQIGKSVLYAPFSGEVSRRAVDEGAVVSVGTPIVTLMEGGIIEARFGIPSDRAGEFSLGSTQQVSVDAGGTVSGVVSRILPEVDAESRTTTVVVELPNQEDLRAGQTARLTQTERQQLAGFWVPSTALVPATRGLWSLYVLGAAEDADTFAVTTRNVEVLHADGDRMLVRGTVQPGDRAIVSGTQRIVPGQLVRPSDALAQ
ncbi:MAG: efflux RND transporter periplasmic adaptor subunit [Geitlerinemataceae cyanobacterium]